MVGVERGGMSVEKPVEEIRNSGEYGRVRGEEVEREAMGQVIRPVPVAQ